MNGSMRAPVVLHQWLINRVNEGMEARGLTQSELAREAGISEKHLSGILTGRVTGSIELWDFLLLVLGTRHEVLGGAS